MSQEDRVPMLMRIETQINIDETGWIPHGKGQVMCKEPGDEMTFTVQIMWVEPSEVEGYETRRLMIPSLDIEGSHDYEVYIVPTSD